MIAEFIFWLSLLALLHSYLFYPLILRYLSKNKKQNTNCFGEDEQWPGVSVIVAAYNEESVIGDKLKSLLNTNYPLEKLEILIGSDGSDDNTVNVIRQYCDQFPQVKCFSYSERRGKATVVNELVEESRHDILIMTDANVLFKENAIPELIKHFKNPAIGVVGAQILNKNIKADGISYQETVYIQNENELKHLEGKVWGTMIGAFGACYALRKAAFTAIPANFLMEDFYLTMQALKKGYKAITEPKAICLEDVSNKISEEFRRKKRISAGNFQNLSRFTSLLWPPVTGLAFSFFSHKVLRWLGPFLILLLFISGAALAERNIFYGILFFLLCFSLAAALLDHLLKKAGVHIALLRFASHFYLMNLALLIGWFKYIKGVKTTVWKPTERNQ